MDMEIKEGTRRTRQDAFLRQWILECAEAMFAERGYHEATMAQIAARAEVGMATLYRHFAGKWELFEAMVYDRYVAVYPRIIEVIDRPGPPTERLRTFLRRALELLSENARMVKVLIRQSPGFFLFYYPAEFESLTLYFKEGEDLVNSLCAEVGREYGLDVDATDLRSLLFAPIASFLFEAFESDTIKQLPDKADLIVEFVVNGLRGIGS